MKRVMWLLMLAISGLSMPLKAQENLDTLPANTIVKPFKLEIGFYKTTVLIFPSPVLLGDRGFNEIITAKEKGLPNILKLKAVQKNFSPTNLHAFTADGRIYPFEVIYSEHSDRFTFDLRKLNSDNGTLADKNSILVSEDPLNEVELRKVAGQVKESKPFLRKSTRKDEMKMKLKSIYISGNNLFFGIEIINKSNMTYDVEFIRTYIRDEQKIKRSYIQEKEINPVFKSHLRDVPGKTKIGLIIALPKFTISGSKKFHIEIFEKNGGRNLSLRIKGRQLLQARNL